MNHQQLLQRSAEKKRAKTIVLRELELDPEKTANEVLTVVRAEMPSLEVPPGSFACWVSEVRAEMGLPSKRPGKRNTAKVTTTKAKPGAHLPVPQDPPEDLEPPENPNPSPKFKLTPTFKEEPMSADPWKNRGNGMRCATCILGSHHPDRGRADGDAGRASGAVLPRCGA